MVVLDVDQRGRIKLSIKELPKYQDNQERGGRICLGLAVE